MWARKVPECFKQSLMGDSAMSSEFQNPGGDAKRKDCTHEVLGGNKNSWELKERPFMLHCRKNLSTFPPCPEIFVGG